MASATRGSMPPPSVAQDSASVSSMARRSTARLSAAISGTQVVDPEYSVGSFVQLLEARFRLRQKRRCGSELGNAFLEQGKRRVELELLFLEARGDRFQALHAGFEAHGAAPSIVAGVSLGTTWLTVAAATPSRITMAT